MTFYFRACEENFIDRFAWWGAGVWSEGETDDTMKIHAGNSVTQVAGRNLLLAPLL